MEWGWGRVRRNITWLIELDYGMLDVYSRGAYNTQSADDMIFHSMVKGFSNRGMVVGIYRHVIHIMLKSCETGLELR